MSDLKSVIIAAEAVVLLVISVADVVSGQFLGAAILLGIAFAGRRVRLGALAEGPDHRARWRTTS